MKKLISLALSLAVATLSTVPLLAAQMEMPANAPKRIAGNITDRITQGDMSRVSITDYAGKQSVVLNVTDATYVVEAVRGMPTDLTKLLDNNVIAYYGPAETKSLPPQSNAVAIIGNIPADFGAPHFAIAEAVEKASTTTKVTTENGSIIVSVPKDILAADKIKVGTSLLLWYDVATLSYPGQAQATKAVVLGDKSTMTTPYLKIEQMAAPGETKLQKGNLPKFTAKTNEKFATELNSMVGNIYKGVMDKATKDKATSVEFSYESFVSDKYTSVVIYGSISAGNTSSDEISTIVLDNTAPKKMSLTGVLGTNAYKLANKAISMQIAKTPEDTYTFDGIDSEPMFYVDDSNSVVIVFNKYSIAPGAMGIPRFYIPLDKVVNKSLTLDTYKKDDITMVPLRTVSEALGYTINWNGNNKPLTLTKAGKSFSLALDKNLYSEKQLESSPELSKGVTYVPISFFEVVMGACYTVDATQITFSALE